jgi:hypothetical protein
VGATALKISHHGEGGEQLLSCGHELQFNSQRRSGAQAYLVYPTRFQLMQVRTTPHWTYISLMPKL